MLKGSQIICKAGVGKGCGYSCLRLLGNFWPPPKAGARDRLFQLVLPTGPSFIPFLTTIFLLTTFQLIFPTFLPSITILGGVEVYLLGSKAASLCFGVFEGANRFSSVLTVTNTISDNGL